jgi:beta-lactam-binding protein with PASTA domain
VPDVRTLSAERAFTDLQQSGFKVVRFDAIPDPTATGQVVRQEPVAGSALHAHDRVLLTVSAGPHPTTPAIFVPGIGTCQMDQAPPTPLCVGEPVLARIHHRH